MTPPADDSNFNIRRRLLVVTLFSLVHRTGAANAAGERPNRRKGATIGAAKSSAAAGTIGTDARLLPPAVAEMRSAILAAVEAGDIAELRHAIDMNEMKPDFGAPPGQDPIAWLAAQSGDGAGREMLAVLGRLLDGAWIAVPGGRDIENNRIYVWPSFAEIPLAHLTPAEEVVLYQLVTPAEAKQMHEAGRWLWWRLSIGADGVWHGFTRGR